MGKAMQRLAKAVLVATVGFSVAAVVPGSASAAGAPCDWKRNDCNFARVASHYISPDTIVATFHAYDASGEEVPGSKKQARIGLGGKTTYFFPSGAKYATLKLTSDLTTKQIYVHYFRNEKDYCYRVTNSGEVHGPLAECHYD